MLGPSVMLLCMIAVNVGEAPQPRTWPELLEGRAGEADGRSSEILSPALGECLAKMARLLGAVFQKRLKERRGAGRQKMDAVWVSTRTDGEFCQLHLVMEGARQESEARHQKNDL